MEKSTPSGARAPRMIDVARLAGVSQQTVSRVVNNQENVAPEVRERVELAIRRLRYRRNPAARALATSRTQKIGIVSFGLAQYGPSVALTGIVDQARRGGYAITLVTLTDADRRHIRSSLDHLLADSVDGIIIIAPLEAALHATKGLTSDVPLVVLEPGAGEHTSNVGTDEVSGAAAATRHLIDLGHKTVHMVSGPSGWLGTKARLSGWSRVLGEAGRPASVPIEGDWTTKSGYLAGLNIAADTSVTAAFIANDQMALGVIKALVDCGLDVPGDVSVIGFDDIPESSYFIPALTTMRVDFEQVGRLAVDRILNLIQGSGAEPVLRVTPELIIRSSTGPPPAVRRVGRLTAGRATRTGQNTTKEKEMTNQKFGKTALTVSSICVGTSALGSFPEQYGYEVSTESAVATIKRVFEGPFTFIDTSNEYGGGESERRIGQAIRENGGVPQGFVIATKVDPLPGSSDFSGDRVRRSVEESLERLGLDRLPLVYFHDPEKISFSEGTAAGGPLDALIKLRDEGLIQYLGVAGGPIDLELQYLATEAFDAVISHNRFTLVEQTAEPLLDDAKRRGVAFVNAAPFGGGMLVKGPKAVPRYCYAPVGQATIARVTEMERLCEDFGVPLAAAALQFSVRDERVTSTIVGMSEAGRVDQTIELAEWDVPEALWDALLPLAQVGRHGIETVAA